MSLHVVFGSYCRCEFVNQVAVVNSRAVIVGLLCHSVGGKRYVD